MRLALVALTALALLGFVALAPEAPLAVSQEAQACAPLTNCVPHPPICWGPHENPTCI